MNLVDRTWRELKEEVVYISSFFRRWWFGMDQDQQVYTLCMICAACLLLGLRSTPQRQRITSYGKGETMGIIQQFLFAFVILMIFTLGLNIAVQ